MTEQRYAIITINGTTPAALVEHSCETEDQAKEAARQHARNVITYNKVNGKFQEAGQEFHIGEYENSVEVCIGNLRVVEYLIVPQLEHSNGTRAD